MEQLRRDGPLFTGALLLVAPIVGGLIGTAVFGFGDQVANDIPPENRISLLQLALLGAYFGLLLGIPIALFVGAPLIWLQQKFGMLGPLSFAGAGLLLAIPTNLLLNLLEMDFYPLEGATGWALCALCTVTGWLWFWAMRRWFPMSPPAPAGGDAV